MQVESERRAKEVIEWRLAQMEMEKTQQDALVIAKAREADREAYQEVRMKKLKLGLSGKLR